MPTSNISSVSSSPKVKSILTIVEFTISTQALGVLCGGLSVCGIIANYINIRTFLKMGVREDGVTLAFLFMAVSDLGLCCSSFITSAAAYILALELGELISFRFDGFNNTRSSPSFVSAVDPSGLGVYSYNLMTMFSSSTVLITLYLAVARCLCVVRPLQFRNAVSFRTTLVTVICIFLYVAVTRFPVLALTYMPVTFNPVFQDSRPGLWLHPVRELVKDYMLALPSMIMATVAQITLSVCVVVMARKLREANKFRNRATTLKESRQPNSMVSEKTKNSDPPLKLNAKDSRIIQQLVLISCIFILCNIPELLRHFSTLVNSQFDVNGAYQSLYYVSGFVVNIFIVVNSGANLFVYYVYNSKFRKMFTIC